MNTERLSRDEWAMRLAEVTARRATCLRRAVGCVLLDATGHVLATGYNGVASGMLHCNESVRRNDLVEELHAADGGYVNITQLDPPPSYPYACPGAQAPSGTQLEGCYAIHAEQNALLQCRDVREVSTCYCTTSPCLTCTKLLLNTGCRRIVYREAYVNQDAAVIWRRAGREWTQLGGAT